jgi:hypothetical protein
VIRRDLQSLTAPLIVRIGGLPASVLASFASDLPGREIAIQALEKELDEARAALADRIYGAVQGAPPELRRYLLAVRRDCFNARGIEKHAGAPHWGTLREIAGNLPARLLEAERRHGEERAVFEEAYARERERERARLAGLIEDRGLLRGIALASPALAANVHRLRAPSGNGPGRRARRLETSLIRYVSRAAFKLSPYSTLTRLGLAALRDDPEEGGLLLGGAWQERSLPRLKRYLLEQCCDLLAAYPPVRSTLRVALNDTIEEIAPERYRFLQPSAWALDPESGAFRYHHSSLVKASLKGPLVSWLLRELPDRRLTYAELVETLEAAELTGQERATLDRLLRIGFVNLLLPWPLLEGHLERAMAALLRELPEDAGAAAVAGVLDRIVALETGYATAPDPVRSVEEIERRIDDLWTAAAPLGGVPPETPRSKLRLGNLYEDVFLSRTGPVPGEIAQIPRAPAERALRDIAPLARAVNLVSSRHDFLHTVAAFLDERWPGPGEVGLMDLFSEIQPLWRDYLKHFAATRRFGGWKTPFNPLGVPAIEELCRLREEVLDGMVCLVEAGPDGSRLDPGRLAELTGRIPDLYAGPVGPCLFLQPVREDCGLWVLNRLYEGTGRYGSRYTPSMDPELRQRYTSALAVRAWDEQGAELLDLACPQGDTLNVHAPQTPRMLELPGTTLDVPASRRVRLSELRVRREEETGLPALTDSSGRLLIPVHLGGSGHDFLPMLVRFLAQFGPAETRLFFPPRSFRTRGEARIWDRLTLGTVVVLRKRWFFEPNTLRSRVEGLGDAAAFAAIDRWRRERGLPDRVFFIEKLHHERRDDLFKPQYVDFTSPLLVAVLRSALEENAASLTFDEVLPEPDQAPRDREGAPWALEVLLDSLALRPASRRPSGSGDTKGKDYDWGHFVERSGSEGRQWMEAYRRPEYREPARWAHQVVLLLRERRFREGTELLSRLEALLPALEGSPSLFAVMGRWYHGALAYYQYCLDDFQAAEVSLLRAAHAVRLAIQLEPFLVPLANHCHEFRLHQARIARNQRRWPAMREHVGAVRAMMRDREPLCTLEDGTPIFFATLGTFYDSIPDLNEGEKAVVAAQLDESTRLRHLESFLHGLYTISGFVIPYR